MSNTLKKQAPGISNYFLFFSPDLSLVQFMVCKTGVIMVSAI